MTRTRVMVVGGGGYFGRLLIRELRSLDGCEVIAAGRGHAPALQGVPFVPMDLYNPRSVAGALDGIGIAICAAGPFQNLPETLALACVDRGIHYADLADDRGYVGRVRSVAPEGQRSGLLYPAWSTCSALTGLLAGWAAQGLDRILAVRTHLAAGNRQPRSAATVSALLSSLGAEFSLKGPEGPRAGRGWSSPRTYPFPAPVGPRTGFLVDSADHDLLPELFAGAAAEFRVSAELGLLNAAASGLASMAAAGFLKDPARWAGPLAKGATLFGALGHDWGGVGVEVQGEKNGRPALRRLSLVAESEGPRLAAYPAFALVRRLLSQEAGPVSHAGWIDRAEFEGDCRSRGWRLVVEGPALD